MLLKTSVIVPFYNTPEGHFNDCLESLKIIDPYEVILVDDCSTNSGTIKLAKQSGFRYLKTDYQSGYDGIPFNMGVKFSTGDYICRVDSDDILFSLPDHITTEILFGRLDRYEYEDNLSVESLILKPRAVLNGIVVERDLCLKYPMAHDKNVFGDIFMVLRLLYNKHSFDISEDINYQYVKRNGSIQTSNTLFYHRLRLIQTVARFCQVENINHEETFRYLDLAMAYTKYGSNAEIKMKENT